MKKNAIIVTILVAAVAGFGGFFAGLKYQQNKRPAFMRQTGNGQSFRPVSGEIIGSDDKSVTVKLQDGSSKIVLLSDSAQINKASVGAKEDLKTGENIVVFGTTNSDGSVTAQSIQIGGQIMMRGGGQNGRSQ